MKKEKRRIKRTMTKKRRRNKNLRVESHDGIRKRGKNYGQTMKKGRRRKSCR